MTRSASEVAMGRTKLAVLLSGSGTTLQNFLDRTASGELDAEVVSVVSSVPGAYGIERAKSACIAACVVDRKLFRGDAVFSDAVYKEVAPHAPDLVLLAGFIHLIRVPAAWIGRVMNVHPALIPSFCGKGYYYDYVHQKVLERGVKVTGCTVHFVDNEYDGGPIIIQKTTPVLDDDTVATLKARVQALEREAYPEAVELFCQGRLRIDGRRVRVSPG